MVPAPLIVSPAPPTVLDRYTPPDDVGYSGGGTHEAELAAAYHFLGMDSAYKETHVDHRTALTYGAVWACVRVISQALASVGWHVYERAEDGRTRLPIEDDIAWMLDLQSSPEMSAFAFREVMLKDALTWGNGYAEIERTNSGKPAWLYRLDTSRVCPDRDQSGRLVYEVENGSGVKNTILDPYLVYHLKGMGADGLVGYDVIAMARRSIKLGLQEEQFGESFYSRGPMPGGILTTPQGLSPEAIQKKREDFGAVYGGSKNAGRVIILTGQQTFTPLSIPNDSAQFLESRLFQVSEIARWFGVPPHKIADLTHATYSNIEEQEIAFVRDCLLPWARRLESEADIKLYGPVRRGRRFTRLNLDTLLRGNSATQTNTVVQKVNNGILTVNEGRAYFDLNPIEGGDTPLVQGAMVPLERVLEEPEPAEPPEEAAPPGQQDAPPANAPPPNVKPGARPRNYNPDQERGEDGRFGEGGGGGKEGDKSAAPAPRTAGEHLQEAAKSSPGLSEQQRESLAKDAQAVIANMPKAAQARADANVKGATFYGSTRDLNAGVWKHVEEKFLGGKEATPEQRAFLDREKEKALAAPTAGAYHTGAQTLHLGGDQKTASESRPGLPSGDTARGVMAHELTHAIDGPNNELSSSDRFKAAYLTEIQHLPGEKPKLSAYASDSPKEGFAEFGRLLYSGEANTKQIEKDFPFTSKFFKSEGLWPKGGGKK